MTAAPSMIGQSMGRRPMLLVVAVVVARRQRHRHQLLRRDLPIHQATGRVRLGAHAPITYRSHTVLLMVAMVAAGMTTAPSMIGQPMEWRPILLVVAAAVARQHRHRHQLPRRYVPIHLATGRVRQEAHAPITYRRHAVLPTVAMVAAGMTAAPSMIGQPMEWRPMVLVGAAAACQHRHRHQLLRRDVPIHQAIGRVRLDAHALISIRGHTVPLNAAMVAAGMTAAPSMIGQSMEWQRMMLVVVVVAARSQRRTHATQPEDRIPHQRQ